MTRRIGFCCQWFHHDRTLKKKQLEEIERPMNTRSTTVRWLNEHKEQAEENGRRKRLRGSLDIQDVKSSSSSRSSVQHNRSEVLSLIHI